MTSCAVRYCCTHPVYDVIIDSCCQSRLIIVAGFVNTRESLYDEIVDGIMYFSGIIVAD